MKTKIIYTAKDIGCFADGTFGHIRLREKLADMVGALGHSALESELHGEMTDDGSEEQDALEILQEATESGLVWAFIDGDLVLLEESEI